MFPTYFPSIIFLDISSSKWIPPFSSIILLDQIQNGSLLSLLSLFSLRKFQCFQFFLRFKMDPFFLFFLSQKKLQYFQYIFPQLYFQTWFKMDPFFLFNYISKPDLKSFFFSFYLSISRKFQCFQFFLNYISRPGSKWIPSFPSIILLNQIQNRFLSLPFIDLLSISKKFHLASYCFFFRCTI